MYICRPKHKRMIKKSLLGMNLEELKAAVTETGLPAFAAKQVARWIYVQHVGTIDEMTNISLKNREALKEHFDIGCATYTDCQCSTDGTKKYLFPTQNGQLVESVYIPDGEIALFVRNIVFSVILSTIVINSILIPLIDKEKGLYRLYLKMLSFNQKMKNMVNKTKHEGEEWHHKHSKAHDFVGEMFHSEVITEIIEHQDKPGAVSNKMESNNMDVAD